eukprot:scaffold81831_cov46-Attheya_sp.AAC.2
MSIRTQEGCEQIDLQRETEGTNPPHTAATVLLTGRLADPYDGNVVSDAKKLATRSSRKKAYVLLCPGDTQTTAIFYCNVDSSCMVHEIRSSRSTSWNDDSSVA